MSLDEKMLNLRVELGGGTLTSQVNRARGYIGRLLDPDKSHIHQFTCGAITCHHPRQTLWLIAPSTARSLCGRYSKKRNVRERTPNEEKEMASDDIPG